MAGLADTIRLRDGVLMPAVGLGTFQGAYDYSTLTDKVCEIVEEAIDAGYRHIDTAWLYNTEEGVGIAVQNKIKQGVVKREDLFITTKLWSPDHKTEDVVPGLKRSLEKLQMTYVDNYLIHWPIALQPGKGDWPKDEDGKLLFSDDVTSLVDTWKGMQQCVEAKLARTIGISNFNIKQMEEILSHKECTIKPSNNQVESHPHFSNREVAEYCSKNGIVMVAFSPLGKPHRGWKKPDDPVVFTDPVLTRIGKKHGKSAAQVALKFNVQRGLGVVPKSGNPQRMRENIDIFGSFKLDEQDIEDIFKECDRHDRVLYLKELLGGSTNYPY